MFVSPLICARIQNCFCFVFSFFEKKKTIFRFTFTDCQMVSRTPTINITLFFSSDPHLSLETLFFLWFQFRFLFNFFQSFSFSTPINQQIFFLSLVAAASVVVLACYAWLVDWWLWLLLVCWFVACLEKERNISSVWRFQTNLVTIFYSVFGHLKLTFVIFMSSGVSDVNFFFFVLIHIKHLTIFLVLMHQVNNRNLWFIWFFGNKKIWLFLHLSCGNSRKMMFSFLSTTLLFLLFFLSPLWWWW